jgi:cyclic-di-GMP-binding protein
MLSDARRGRTNMATQQPEANIRSVLSWLSAAGGRSGSADAEELLAQLQCLRQCAIPTVQQIKLLDLLYLHCERVVDADLAQLRKITLPISRRVKQRIQLSQRILEALTQDYLNTLSEIYDPQHAGSSGTRPAEDTLSRVVQCLVWNITISHLAAAPHKAGIWHQFHAVYANAHQLGLAQKPCSLWSGKTIHRIYTSTLLAAIAQPASFSAEELQFISDYIEHSLVPIELSTTPSGSTQALFWIDADKDLAAQAVTRRSPPLEKTLWFFDCTEAGLAISRQLTALEKGVTAEALTLPAFAETKAGRRVLKRLRTLWSKPAKRRFNRRRQSYRALLCAGLQELRQLAAAPQEHAHISEWMVTNESPDGFAMMHVSGPTHLLQVGDVVAVQPIGEQAEKAPEWLICLVRWALSDNPEHVELGLELIAAKAFSANIVSTGGYPEALIPALVLPESPPLRRTTAMIVPTGSLDQRADKLVMMIEKGNLEIREVRPTHLDEQTSSVDVISFRPDDIPESKPGAV